MVKPIPIDQLSALTAALETQLGLTLVPTRVPVSTFVIDHIERPTEN